MLKLQNPASQSHVAIRGTWTKLAKQPIEEANRPADVSEMLPTTASTHAWGNPSSSHTFTSTREACPSYRTKQTPVTPNLEGFLPAPPDCGGRALDAAARGWLLRRQLKRGAAFQRISGSCSISLVSVAWV